MPSPRPVQQASGPLPGQLHGVLEPIVTGAGFELEELDVRVAGRRHTIKLVVDSDSGVGLDDIARVSRAVSAELDQHADFLDDAYTLEVTSPGTDRPLTAPRHWRRAHLRLVAVRTREGATFTGRVGPAGELAVAILTDGTVRELPYDEVAHAAVEVEFNPPPAAEVEMLQEAHVPGTTATTPEGPA
jgi:ribosome maturation factor RimP